MLQCTTHCRASSIVHLYLCPHHDDDSMSPPQTKSTLPCQVPKNNIQNSQASCKITTTVATVSLSQRQDLTASFSLTIMSRSSPNEHQDLTDSLSQSNHAKIVVPTDLPRFRSWSFDCDQGSMGTLGGHLTKRAIRSCPWMTSMLVPCRDFCLNTEWTAQTKQGFFSWLPSVWPVEFMVRTK